MNEPQFYQKTQQDVNRIKKDVNNLKEESINQVSKINEDTKHFTEEVADWVNKGVAQLSSEFEKVKDDTTKTVAHATSSVKKNVGNGLSQYNAKVTEVAEKLPGDVGVKAGKYPWVSISFALMAGFLLRGFLMPARNHRK